MKLSNKQATVYAAIAFVLVVLLNVLLPRYTTVLSGLMLVIYFSVFVRDRKSTYIALGAGITVVLASMFFHPDVILNTEMVVRHLIIVLLLCFSAYWVLYTKRLYEHMEFDKTHMTALFENATEGIVLTNQDGRIILMNPASERMFGYGSGQAINQPVEVLIPNPLRRGHEQLRKTYYGHPQHRAMGSGRDLYAERKDGSTFPVEVSLSHYKKGDELFIIAFVVDITHRKEIEENMRRQQQQLEKITDEIRSLNAELEAKVDERTVILKEALQRLEQSQAELSEALDKERQLNEIKSRFVSMASHEFRTPLSAVLSSASLLSKYTTTEQQANRDKHIRRIKESVKNLNDILEDFLSLGKLDEGKISASPAVFDLKEFTEDTIEDMKGILKQGQQVDYVHEGPTEMHSDKRLLRNILINLISNAVKFSEEQKVVTIRTRLSDGQAAISVKDEGIGIAQEDQQHLFSSFFRGKNAVNIQGTGLGLHIVKRYLDLLGGDIQLQSTLGKGTLITVTIPVNLHQNGKENSGH